MANKKFSEFTLKTDSANVDFVVGYDGTDNVRIAPSNLGGGGASDLNGLSDCLVDTDSVYIGEVPSGLSGNPQGNLIVGVDAGNALTTGTNNTLIGNDAGLNLTTHFNTTAVGMSAGKSQNAESFNTYIGYQAGRDHIGAQSVLMSANSRIYNNGKNSNGVTAIGYSTHDVNAGNFSTAIGYSAGNSATGDSGTYVGRNAGRVNTGSSNVCIGHNAGYSQTSGTANTNVGSQAGYSNTTSQDRTMIGDEAGAYQTGAQNTGVGRYACRQGTGLQNVAVGASAMVGNMSGGSFNTVVGYNAMSKNGNKSNNVVVGKDAARLMTTGSTNTILGSLAGDNLTTGSNNILIGYDATASAVTVSNEITLGDSNIATLRCQVQTISSLSDSRDKTNIEKSTYGLDFINKLNPVTFDWNMRDGAKVGDKDLGFIAQELQEVDDENLKLVYSNNPDRLEASYGRLIPVLVKAIQELKLELDNCKNCK